MKYNFDAIISREGTFSEKFDRRLDLFGRADVIPMWVADMDFAPPPAVTEAIVQRAHHPILGYTARPDGLWQSIMDWENRRNGWTVKREWLDCCPGVVPGIVYALRAFTKEGDGVLIQPPVYHPFARQARMNNREVINNPLKCVNGRFEIDFQDLDRKLAECKVFILCNPHNPTGRVFTEDELLHIGELCVKHDVLILSDEIHSDLVYKPNQHIHIAALRPEFAERTITFIAPSKTFNIAGLATSVSIATNPTLYRQLQLEYNKLHVDAGSIFGSIGLEAAYNHGNEWLEELLVYLKRNVDYVLNFLAEKMPSVKAVVPEATYLMFLDFSAWPLSHEQIFRFLADEAGIGVNEGSMFGEEGTGWMRFNIATQFETVKQAMDQLYAAYVRVGIGG